MFDVSNIPTQSIIVSSELCLDVKRLDLIHSYVSGNKYYKLKYNLQQVQSLFYTGILSFGGAYSNHILALAFACNQLNLKSIAIIRGDELRNKPLNPILQQAQSWGMDFIFVSREEYRLRYHQQYLDDLQNKYPDYYILPEGGHNDLAIQGCSEILSAHDLAYYDYICCAVGTGGTLSGLSRVAKNQTVLGFSALKQMEFKIHSPYQNWQILQHYCFGGYAKVSPTLCEFIQYFQNNFNIPLEPIYTAKMMYGIFDLIQQGFFKPQSRILAIHTGGLVAGQLLLKGQSNAI